MRQFDGLCIMLHLHFVAVWARTLPCEARSQTWLPRVSSTMRVLWLFIKCVQEGSTTVLVMIATIMIDVMPCIRL